MLTKIIAQQSCPFEVAVAWTISAKSSVKNVHGFSPNQLVFGSNHNFPNVISNAPPALKGKTTIQIVADNLNAMHATRQIFIQSESAEKLQRYLRHQVRTSGDTKYFTGDVVYYRKKDGPCPRTVIGQEGNQVSVKPWECLYQSTCLSFEIEE